MLARENTLLASKFEGKRFDIGTVESAFLANLELILMDGRIPADFRDQLKHIL